MTRYTVETLRSGQPRPYADSEYEYKITCEDSGWKEGDPLRPWVMFGDVESTIRRDEAARKAKTMFGGETPEQLRKSQRDWALGIVRALCQNFREANDQDGRAGMEAHFYPTLKRITVNASKGEILALIIRPYTD